MHTSLETNSCFRSVRTLIPVGYALHAELLVCFGSIATALGRVAFSSCTSSYPQQLDFAAMHCQLLSIYYCTLVQASSALLGHTLCGCYLYTHLHKLTSHHTNINIQTLITLEKYWLHTQHVYWQWYFVIHLPHWNNMPVYPFKLQWERVYCRIELS